MAINVVAIVVCLFLIAQYLEGTLHKGVRLGGKYQLLISSYQLRVRMATGQTIGNDFLHLLDVWGQQEKACSQRGE